MASAAASPALAGPPITETPACENTTLESMAPGAGPPKVATLKGSYLGLPATYTATADAAIATLGRGARPTLVTIGGSSTYSITLTMSQSEMNELVRTAPNAPPAKYQIAWVTINNQAQAGYWFKVNFTRL